MPNGCFFYAKAIQFAVGIVTVGDDALQTTLNPILL